MDKWLNCGTSSHINSKEDIVKEKIKVTTEYLTLGFTSIYINNAEQPVWVVYHETLSNESMKLAKLH